MLDLLFILATWHAYAKLRLHTDSTLQSFDAITKTLGKIIRQFVSKTCKAFVTKELPQEHAARGRRKAAKVAKTGKNVAQGKTSTGVKIKHFNLQTYKLHALGDYPSMIRRFGTTDSYTTQIVSL